MGTENPLFLMSGDFKFYCFFSSGDGISGYFSHRGAPGTNFGPLFFSVGRGSHRVCDTGVCIGSWSDFLFSAKTSSRKVLCILTSLRYLLVSWCNSL